MKNWIVKLCLLTFIVTAMFGGYHFSGSQRAEAAVPEEMRGMWIASVYNIDFPGKQNLSVSQMKQELNQIIADAEAMNLNAVFFQVRPTADALYDSALFPWSKYLTGSQGKAPAQNFDPLEYLIRQGKAHGIEIHAWINPYKTESGFKCIER